MKESIYYTKVSAGKDGFEENLNSQAHDHDNYSKIDNEVCEPVQKTRKGDYQKISEQPGTSIIQTQQIFRIYRGNSLAYVKT